MHFITSYTDTYKDKLLDITSEVARAGVDIIQFSYENAFDGEILDLAFKVKEICNSNNIKLCINNRMDIANIVGADFLHIGQLDLPIEIVREHLHEDIKIGLTITSSSQLHPLADYYGVGPIFPTVTKNLHNEPIGLEALVEICNSTDKPVTAIGGINIDNYESILKAGAYDAAIIGDVYRASDINGIIHNYNIIKEKYDTYRNNNTSD